MKLGIWSACFAIVFVGCQPAEDPDPDPAPDRLGHRVVDALGGLMVETGVEERLEYRIDDLDDTELAGAVTYDSCEAVEGALSNVCGDLYAAGEVVGCSYLATFFYAHDVPRCAVRFETYTDPSWQALSDLFVLDFAGDPIVGAAPTCGNGILDDGESCDDGNHEMWDGCDPNCNNEPFVGCEAVIEAYYAQAGIARVPEDSWTGPRSHLMVNHGTAMMDMSDSTCNAALSMAADVCNALTTQMPFVSWCQPSGEFHSDERGPACSIRLTVGFWQLSPETGVFTTSLTGILAFTIR